MKNSTPHEISMSYRIESAPSYLSRADILREMIEAVFWGRPPRDLRITWSIRGVEKDFADVIKTANAGLLRLMERRLRRDLEAL